MAITGPVLLGSQFQRNQQANQPLSFNVAQNVPVGSVLFGVWGTDAPDTADCQMSDAAGNNWTRMVQSMDPNNTGFMTNVFFCKTTAQINSGQAISMLCTVRASFGGPVYMFSGAQGSLTGSLVKWSSEWSGTPLAPNGQVFARAGQSVFACLAVAGPNNDVFTQDSNFGADVTASATGFNATVHGTARHAVPIDGNYTYAPTLNNARQGVMAMLAFS